jgi:hypothetical protein
MNGVNIFHLPKIKIPASTVIHRMGLKPFGRIITAISAFETMTALVRLQWLPHLECDRRERVSKI